MKVNDRVQIDSAPDGKTHVTLTGHVSRVWANGRYVTVITDDGRTFVREVAR